MLEIQNLSKYYGKKQILHHVSFKLEPGDICGFIGANGAGKTTTIKSAIGLIPFEEGSVTIDEHSIESSPVECKKILSYVPDNPSLYTFMTGIEYLNFIGDVFEMTREQRKEKIDYYGNAFDIFSRLNETISDYSHGMQQKLALIAALMHSPKLLILDEPFVGLDPTATRFIREEFKRLADEEGMSILFSTHVLEVAEKLCNRVVIIRDGHIVLDESMEEALKEESLEDLFISRMSDHE